MQFRFRVKVVVVVKTEDVRLVETVTAGKTGGISVAYRVVVPV